MEKFLAQVRSSIHVGHRDALPWILTDYLRKKEQYIEIVNESLRETFGRSIVTTFTTLIPVVILIFLGSHEILNFNIALLFGLISGVYSSLFIASQLWLDLDYRHNLKNQKKPKKKTPKKEDEEILIKGINA